MPRDLHEIRAEYSRRRTQLNKLAENLQRELEGFLSGVPNIDRISFRMKAVDSFVAKAASTSDDGAYKYAHPLEEIEDQVAGRVLVFYRDDIASVLAAVENRWRKAEQKHRRPANPNEFDYETTHRVCLITPDMMPNGWSKLPDPPQTFELQIRTLAQHAWSEPQHEFYKRGTGLKPESLRKLYWAAASAWGMDSIWQELKEELNELQH